MANCKIILSKLVSYIRATRSMTNSFALWKDVEGCGRMGIENTGAIWNEIATVKNVT